MWKALTRYCHDGRIEIDTSAAERIPARPQFIDFVGALVGLWINGCNRGILFVIATTHLDTLIRGIVAEVVDAAVKIKCCLEFVRIPVVDIDLTLFTWPQTAHLPREKMRRLADSALR